MRKSFVLLLLGIILMIGAAITSPESYEPPPSVFVKSNFQEFQDELPGYKMGEPYKCISPEIIVVTCHIENDWELNRTIDALSRFPRSSIGLENGYDEVDVIVLNETLFYQTLPDFCRHWGRAAMKPEPRERDSLEAKLKAYRELEEVINDTSEREFIHNRTVDLEYLLGLKEKEPVCNATWATVVLMYPVKKTSNAPLMATFWAGVILTGIAGLVMAWLERRN